MVPQLDDVPITGGGVYVINESEIVNACTLDVRDGALIFQTKVWRRMLDGTIIATGDKAPDGYMPLWQMMNACNFLTDEDEDYYAGESTVNGFNSLPADNRPFVLSMESPEWVTIRAIAPRNWDTVRFCG